MSPPLVSCGPAADREGKRTATRQVLATLQEGGAPLHGYQVRAGFREARFGLDGFFLNGRRVKLFGVNRHQFYPFAAGAMSARVQRRDAAILRRELNCNRTTHRRRSSTTPAMSWG